MRLIINDKLKQEIFGSLFSLLKNWSSHINIQFDTNKITIQTMDKSHICLANIELKSQWFSVYECSVNNKISVDSNQFAMLMNYALKRENNELKYDTIEITFEEDVNPDKLYINFLNNNKAEDDGKAEDAYNSDDDGKNKDENDANDNKKKKNKKTKKEEDKKEKKKKEKEKKSNFEHFFELNLIEVDEDSLGIPMLEYDVDFTIETKHFTDLLAELNAFSQDINIICSVDKIELNAIGESTKLKVNIPIDELNEYAIAEEDVLNMSFSLGHLCRMCCSTKLCQNVSVSLNNDYPMCLKYDLGDESVVYFYVAPKVTE